MIGDEGYLAFLGGVGSPGLLASSSFGGGLARVLFLGGAQAVGPKCWALTCDYAVRWTQTLEYQVRVQVHN